MCIEICDNCDRQEELSEYETIYTGMSFDSWVKIYLCKICANRPSSKLRIKADMNYLYNKLKDRNKEMIMKCKKCNSEMKVCIGDTENTWYCPTNGCGNEEPFSLAKDVERLESDYPYPEHAKIDDERLATLTEFFEYLQANNIVLAQCKNYVLDECEMSAGDIAYGFLGVNAEELEEERKAMVK